MPLTSYKTRVEAPADRLWALLIDKIRNPDRYVPGIDTVTIVREFGPSSIERQMDARQGDSTKTVHEIITADEVTRTVIFKLKDDPDFTGYVINMIFEEEGVVELDYTLHWTPKRPDAHPRAPDVETLIRRAVLHTKDLAERAD